MDLERKVTIPPWAFLHARTAHMLAEAANRFTSEITLSTTDSDANAKSIMSMLVLEARDGTELTFSASGRDAESALETLVNVVLNFPRELPYDPEDESQPAARAD